MSEVRELLAQYVEEIARSWASIDGKLKEFEACKANSKLEDDLGHYEGYITEASELLRRSPATLHKLLQQESGE